jgi:hypothetical protein
MTRLIWVLVFAVLVGAVLLFFAKSFRAGSGVNELMAEISAAQSLLARQYPQANVTIRSAQSRPGVRNLVVFVAPGAADSAAAERMADSALMVVAAAVNPRGFDSLIVALDGVAVRARALR